MTIFQTDAYFLLMPIFKFGQSALWRAYPSLENSDLSMVNQSGKLRVRFL